MTTKPQSTTEAASCDYRNKDCAAYGVTIGGKWVCNNHICEQRQQCWLSANTRSSASTAPVVDNERCYCQCHFQVTIRQDSCSHCDKCVMCGHAMQVDVSGFCVEMVLFGQGGDKTDFVRCGCQCASATQYTTAAAATAARQVEPVTRDLLSAFKELIKWHHMAAKHGGSADECEWAVCVDYKQIAEDCDAGHRLRC